jgi:hypothetical protein
MHTILQKPIWGFADIGSKKKLTFLLLRVLIVSLEEF